MPAGGPGSVAARLGGDEFALLLTGLDGPDDAAVLARALCARIATPVELTEGTVAVGASIGVALSAAGLGTDDLTRRADNAMYTAKSQGKNRVELYHPRLHGDRTPTPQPA